MVISSPKSISLSIQRRSWCLTDSYDFLASFLGEGSDNGFYQTTNLFQRKLITYTSNKRHFHNYFVTNVPSSSLRSDSPSTGLHHRISRSALRHQNSTENSSSSNFSLTADASRDLTVVRIPLKSAKKHFGVSQSRGTRPSNEDTYQAGTIEIPAFARKSCVNHVSKAKHIDIADSASGGPQVFCFGVFDGHGGKECSNFLKERLHEYVEKTADLFELESSLQNVETEGLKEDFSELNNTGKDIPSGGKQESKDKSNNLQEYAAENIQISSQSSVLKEDCLLTTDVNPGIEKVLQLEKSLVQQWKDKFGGYFRRFNPQHFNLPLGKSKSIESVLMYAFLRADLDFLSTQNHRPVNAPNTSSSTSLNSKFMPSKSISSPARFVGGSTASIALISTPTPSPFWHPLSSSTMIVAHVGDTRIILCETSTGLAKPCTTNHHPSSPTESSRLRRYATSFVTDSFGEERIYGLANTRAFGDLHSKRIGVSAEPEINRIELTAAKYSMLILVSDGVSGTLADQEIVDIVKEAETPEQGASDVVKFATEVSQNGDNATCLVVRLGGWKKRREGGLGSLGTKECREWRRGDTNNMRRVERHR